MTQKELNNAIIDAVENDTGFMKHNNMKIEYLEKNYATISVELTSNSMNPTHFAHGGLIFGLADSAMGMAARTNGKNVVTVNANIDYLKPGKGKKLIAKAEPVKVGKTLGVYRTNIYNDKDELVSTVTGTFFFLDDERLK